MDPDSMRNFDYLQPLVEYLASKTCKGWFTTHTVEWCFMPIFDTYNGSIWNMKRK
jgi:hypothetical protein